MSEHQPPRTLLKTEAQKPAPFVLMLDYHLRQRLLNAAVVAMDAELLKLINAQFPIHDERLKQINRPRRVRNEPS